MKSLIVLISNPAARNSSPGKVAAASRFLGSRGFEVEKSSTGKRGDAEALAREAVGRSPSLVIAAGGDGTINEVMNGLAGSDIPVAILPMGTTNVLAGEINIPADVLKASEIAVSREPKAIALGRVSFPDRPALPSRHFCLMAGVGYDGETVWGMNHSLKKLSGKGAYVYSGIRTLLKFCPEELTFVVDGETYSGYSAIIGNAARYGGNFRVTPDASLTTPVLYVCIFKGKRRSDFLRYVFGILTGNHLGYRDVEYLKTGNITVNGRAHVQIDGDYLGLTPIAVDLVRDAVRLVF